MSISLEGLTVAERTRLLGEARRAGLSRRVRPAQVPIRAVARNGAGIEASGSQQRLWFLSQLPGVSEAYQIVGALRLEGDLDEQALGGALDEIVCRHESLRTRFEQVEGRVLQVIAEGGSFELRRVDLRQVLDGAAAVEREEEVGARLREEMRRGFDLQSGPLIRGVLLRESQHGWVLLVMMHHIISDGWSMGILMNEFSTLYAGLKQGGGAGGLERLQIQYADYALWQREPAQRERAQEQLEYWQEHLSGAPAVLELPRTGRSEGMLGSAGGGVQVSWDASFTQELKRWSERHGLTLYMSLLAGWAAVLGRLSGQEEVVIGTVVANRGRAELEGLIGFFVNTLALRIGVKGSQAVHEYVQRVKQVVVQGQAHQEVSFEQVVERLNPQRSLAHSAVFQVLFAWQNAPGGSVSLPGLRVQGVSVPVSTTQFELSVSLGEGASGGIEGTVSYASGMYEQERIQGYVRYWQRMLQGMMRQEQQELGRMLLLDAQEREQVLVQWNRTESAYPSERCVHELFEEQAQRSPDAIAVVYEEEQLTYAQLNERANRLAHHLRARGVVPDTRVGICLERGIGMVVGLLGILKAGGAYVPLDPSYPIQRLRYLLEDSQPLLVLGDERAEQLLSEQLQTVPFLNVHSDAAAWAHHSGHNPTAGSIGLHSHHLAYIIYTSGSTGEPKGVMVEHAQVARLFSTTQEQFRFGSEDVWTLFHSYAFDFSVWEMWGALLHGGRLIVVAQEVTRAPERFYRLVCESGVTILNQTPSAFRQLQEAQRLNPQAHRLRRVIFGGEALEVSSLAGWYEQNRGSETVLVNMYGITETTVHVTYRQLHEQEVGQWRTGSPIGQRLKDLRTYILDEYRQPTPVGVAGELYVGGAGVARGYLNRAQLTAQRFLPDPFSTVSGERMYRTGDLGRWRADGTIEYLGRNDQQVKIRGYRIELGEIEAQLAQHPQVKEAVVLAREDVPGEKRLVAYVRPTDADHSQETRAALSEELRAHLKGKLPHYMVPAAFVMLESLPLTGNGKLDRKALPAPELTDSATTGYVAPATHTEQRICEIWSQALGLKRVGVEDDYFAIGGDSILSIRVAGMCRDAGLSVNIEDLFRHRTIRRIALEIQQRTHTPPPTVAAFEMLTARERGYLESRQDIEDAYPLSSLQAGMYFHSELDPDTSIYHDLFSCCLNCRFDPDKFSQALDGLVSRHPVLRSSFLVGPDGRPLQLVHGSAPVRVHVQAIAHLDAQEQDALIASWMQREKYARFDWASAPLLRIFVHLRGEGRFQYGLSFHHAILDGWSLATLQSELLEHYCALLEERTISIEAPVARYRDFIAQEQRTLHCADSRAFWRERMSGVAAAVLAAPGATPGSARHDETGRHVTSLSDELARQLSATAVRLGFSLKTLLLAAHVKVMSVVFGRHDVLTGLVSNGRPEVQGGERVLGLYLNTVPLRVQTQAGSWRTLIGQVAEAELAGLPHRAFPLHSIQRLTDGGAQFDTMFNFTHFHVYENVLRSGIQVTDLTKFEHTNFSVAANFSHSIGKSGLALDLEYDQAVLSGQEAARIGGYYLAALQFIVAEPDRGHHECSLLDAQEREQVLVQWNRTESAYPSERCVHELFEEQVQRTPDAIAVVYEEEQLTYAQLNERANQVARELKQLGVQLEDRVGVCLERSLGMVVGLLGVLKAGAGYVPLDPGYPPERLRYMLGDATPRVVLIQEHLRAVLPPGIEGSDAAGMLMLDRDWPRIGAQASTNLQRAETGVSATSLAYVIYTSGSTGEPKGVMVEHSNTVNMLHWARSAFDEEALSYTLFCTSVTFDLAVYECFVPLTAGACIRIVSSVLDLMNGPVPVTLINTVPSAIRALLDRGNLPESAASLNLAGEALSQELVERIFAKTSVQSICNLYGPSETTTYSTWVRMERKDGFDSSIGRPISNTQIYILDRYESPVPVGVQGEIYIGGAGVARGYLNRAQLTAQRFLPDPFSTVSGARMYRTGDLGRWRADGTIEYLGRNDQQVKIRGYRIELGEIEAQLLKEERIAEAVVVAREDVPGEKRLVAYVRLTDSDHSQETRAALIEGLRAQLKGRMPEYMVPAAFVVLESLPLTANGKLDRKALPAPEGDAYVRGRYEAPVGELEEQLAQVWQELLQVERVGRHDDFFELGGHSLLAITVIERLRRLDIRRSVRDIFVHPVLSDLAQVRDEAGSQSWTVPANAIAAGSEQITPSMLPLIGLEQQEIDRIVGAVSGGAGNVQDIYPLSPLQEGLLFHHLMSERGDGYQMPALLEFESRERVDEFLGALREVIARHDILRTAVMWEGLREAVQVVWREAPLRVQEVCIEAGAGEAAQWLRERYDPHSYRIDIREAPLLRGFAGQDMHSGRWLLLMMSHHLALDHTTLELVLEEVGAHLRGQAGQLPAPVPFREFVARSRMRQDRQQEEEYFRERFGDVSEPTAPFGLLQVQGDGSGIEEHRQVLEPQLCGRIRRAARAAGVSAASVCHVAWARVLGTLSGREDVVFGTVLFGRMQGGAGVQRALGMFINTLPVRVKMQHGSVQQILKSTHEELSELMQYEYASLSQVQRCSGVGANVPLFTALLNYRHSPAPSNATAEQWPGMRVLSVEERTNYPVVLSVDDLGEGFTLTMQVQQGLRAQRLNAFVQHTLQELVQALEQEPGRALRQVQVLDAQEREQVLVQWNRTESAYPSERCVHELFEEQAQRTPDAIAVVYEEEQLTYAQLNERANRLAHHLREHGVVPGEHVVIGLVRSMELVIAQLAVLKCAAVYVPIDQEWPHERQLFMIRDCQAKLALCDSSQPLISAPGLSSMNVAQVLARLQVQGAACSNLEVDADAEASAYVMYTSGSTGEPKGVMVPHRAISRLALNNQYLCLEASDRIAFAANPAFDASTFEVWSALLNGAGTVILSKEALFDRVSLGEALSCNGVTTLFLTTALFNQYASVGASNEVFGSLKYLLFGGELSDPNRVRQVLKDAPCQLLHVYGPTEATTFSTSYVVESVDESCRSIPIGRPISNTQIYILDRYESPVPVGVQGEIYIGGAGVARGYLNRAQLTAQRFLPDPFSTVSGARMYRTGDLGRWRADGTIEYLGRNDQQVKIRGYRIELGEIEAQLTQHPQVKEAVVLAREDVPGEKRLVAYYTSAEATVEIDTLRAQLQPLPTYMIPAAYVRLESLPLTANGKLDRKALPAPEGDAYVRGRYEAPVGELEEQLAQVWQELLQVERVGRHDDFFELGGHSLLAVRLISHILHDLSLQASVQQIFQHPTIESLARELGTLAAQEVTPIRVADREALLPLSFAQQRLWFITRLDEQASRAYHIPAAARLRGPLDEAALRAALNQIVARHESLRTRFVYVDGEVTQKIDPPQQGLALRRRVLHGGADSDMWLQEWIEEEASSPFCLETGPLIRGQLISLDPEEHVLLLTMHHIVSDGWSLGILFRELATLYETYRRGEEDPLPPLSVQYADYAQWQRRWLEGERLQEQASYWRSALQGAPQRLALPCDHARPSAQDYLGASEKVELDEGLTAALKALSQRQGATLFMTVLTGWAALLGRLSNQAEVVIGTPTANRMRTEIEGLIGFFVNTLAIRVDLSGSPSTSELLQRVKSQTLAAQTHQDIPFEQVVEQMKPERSLSHSPIFQVMLGWHNLPVIQSDTRASTLRIEEIGQPTHSTQFDLSLSLREVDGRVVGTLVYASALFEAQTIRRYLSYWRRILEGMAMDEARAVEKLGIMPAAERDEILRQWNRTEEEYSEDLCIHELFEEQVRRTPDSVALQYEEDTLSYAELNVRANRLARYLRKRGVGPDVLVGICAARGLEMVVGVMGILKAGGTYMPLDPAHPAKRLVNQLFDSEPLLLLTDADGRAALSAQALRIPVVDLCADSRRWSRLSGKNPSASGVGLCPDHLAYVIYTSGSTGTPKGVMVEHRSVCNLTQAQIRAFEVGPGSRTLQWASLSFDACVSEVMCSLCSGGTLCLPRAGEVLGGEALLETIRRHRISHVTLIPTVLSGLVADGRLGTVKTLVVAGEECPQDLVKRYAPKRRFINAYGPTEATVCATLHVCDERETGSPSIGRPISNTQIYILDRYESPVPVGVQGEIYIGGAGVARGYLNRAQLTAQRFLPDPFSTVSGARMYRTGDLGRWRADGTIEYLGRNDQQVKIRGYRIELGEIEAQLTQHPQVKEAVVLAREDVPGEKRLVAYYTSAEATVEIDTLRAQLQPLPTYMIPAAYVRLESLPLTANGKLDRKALPAPEGDAYVRGRYEAPVGELEEQLAQVWQELLQVERVGRHDDFFELGGHSLLAITVIERLRRLDIRRSVRDIFVHPVLSDLAQVRDEAGSQSWTVPANAIAAGSEQITPSMLPLIGLEQQEIDRIVGAVSGGAGNVQDIYPLSPLQEGLLFHHLMSERGDGYQMPALLEFESRERVDEFLGALREVIARHDILRTAVMWEGLREAVQVVWREAPLRVQEVCIEAGAGEAAQWLRERYDPHSYRIDIREAPLLRGFAGQDMHSGRWLLLMMSHHLALDHTTLELVLEEVGAHLRGQAGQLPAPVPFREFVARSRMRQDRQQEEEYFRERFGDVSEPTAPFGLLQVQGDGSGIEEHRQVLEPQLCGRIRRAARAAGVSAASVCHVAWARVLGTLSGREDVVFGTVLFGRMQGGAGVQRALGMFINTLPVRVKMQHGSVQQILKSTHEELSELMQYEYASLSQVQRCSGVGANVPLFTALLNYRHSPAPSNATAEQWPGMRVLSVEERTNYPVVLSVDDLGEGFTLTMQVQQGLRAQRLNAFVQHTLQELVQALEQEPGRALRQVQVLDAQEREQVLVQWNRTESAYPSERCVHELFEEQVQRSPDAIAVVYEEEQLTYAQLNERANRLAHHLRERGVVPDTRVGICLERGIGMVVGLLGILKAGGAYVPLDPSYPIQRLRYLLEDSQPLLVLGDERAEQLLSEQLQTVPFLNVHSGAAAWAHHSGHNPTAGSIGLHSHHLAYIIYTSGSTGEPKGVMIEQRGLSNYLHWTLRAYAPPPGGITPVSSSIAFDATVTSLYVPLLTGGTLHLIPQGKELEGLEQRIRDAVVLSLVKITPPHLHALGERLLASRSACAVRMFVIGGEALLPATVRLWREVSPQSRLINEYGPTETVVGCCTYEVGLDWEPQPTVPIGKPIANTVMYVLDEGRSPVPVGVQGEIYIGGAGVARGYLNRAQLTAQRFLPDPFSTVSGARMYRTGDLGRWRADGTIEYLGRNDQQVKIRGYRIELGEIEAQLLKEERIAEAVVVAREDVPGEKRLVAYVRLTDSDHSQETRAALIEGLRAQLKGRMPEYMVPAAFVVLESLPLTANGKLDRKALPAPEGDAYVRGRYEAPVGELEEQLAQVWQELLQVERVGRHDDFFELGGHSLLAVAVVARMLRLDLHIEVNAIFNAPTISALSSHVTRVNAATASKKQDSVELDQSVEEGVL